MGQLYKEKNSPKKKKAKSNQNKKKKKSKKNVDNEMGKSDKHVDEEDKSIFEFRSKLENDSLNAKEV
jgi:hypothetical protein